MRKIITLNAPVDGIVRLMIYSDDYGSYLFGYDSLQDSGALWDQYYENEADVIEVGTSEYGVHPSQWVEINDPKPYCQHDWIKPVRVKGRDINQTQFGVLEYFVAGEWKNDINKE